jgi:hypothetical protein
MEMWRWTNGGGGGIQAVVGIKAAKPNQNNKNKS